LIARGTPIWIAVIPLFSLIAAVVFLLLDSVYFIIISAVFILLFIPLILFFRDPERKIAEGVVCPADGKIMEIERKGQWITIKTFMNVHNVHVNRWPFEGRIVSMEHISGGYVPAFDKDSDRNERVRIRFTTGNGTWEITQIAGAVARRIVPYVDEGDVLAKGDRFGLIRFGSRVDIRFKLPRGHRIAVEEGQTVKAGSTSLSR
jgi:phosphatidylserine decarboxylase